LFSRRHRRKVARLMRVRSETCNSFRNRSFRAYPVFTHNHNL
jgi:hypothetical protein